MGRFVYRGQCPGGTAIDGTLEARSVQDAIEQLESMRVRVVEVREAPPPKPTRGVGHDDFMFFNDQLASLARSGLALDRGLREIAADVRSKRLRHVIHRIAEDVQRGTPLDQAVAAHETRLPVLYSRVIRAGVKTNQLSAMLLNLSSHLSLLAEFRRITFETLSYPVIVFVAALTIMSVVVIGLVPQYEDIIQDFNARVPALTAMVFALARVYPWLLGAAITILGAAVLLWMFVRATPGGRRAREWVVSRIPVVGGIVRVSLQARLFRAVALAVQGGIPLSEALRLAAGATGSIRLATEADQVATRLEAGDAVGTACQGTTVIPPVFGYVAGAAAEGRTLPDALSQLAGAYEQQARHRQGILRAWLLPLAVVFVAVSVGLCIVAMFLPLMTLIQSVSGG